MTLDRPLRLLVVDDSAYNRRIIADIFEHVPEVEVVGKAADGEEALRMVGLLKPDVLTLDLEMPRMDGFTFLRIVMAKFPAQVIVVSSYSQRENVFRALELGALDFIAKPTQNIGEDAHALREQVLQKVLLVRSMQGARKRSVPPASSGSISRLAVEPRPAADPPRTVVGVAASTGGPSALLEIFSRLSRGSMAAVLVAQHMPDKFTRTFAERLDKRGPFRVAEAAGGEALARRTAYVCPGRQCLELEGEFGRELRLSLVQPGADDRFVPSANRLFASLARVAKERAVGVILTGMGDDGVEGARAIRAAGGTVIAESAETAVVNGMPDAAIKAGVVDKVLPLPAIADYLAGL
ncbi:MAG TPA: chemotaxis-specific protein-glutamate methyltransferase CheB [Polyangiaceae bacterium]|nr:chemotaxis-specific protein-glutamate methyltransferase CheB [Polyangiaceae bacterium]